MLCTLYTVHCILYNVHCTLYTVYCTLYSLQCCVHCTLYNVQCTVYNVMYSVVYTRDPLKLNIALQLNNMTEPYIICIVIVLQLIITTNIWYYCIGYNKYLYYIRDNTAIQTKIYLYNRNECKKSLTMTKENYLMILYNLI